MRNLLIFLAFIMLLVSCNETPLGKADPKEDPKPKEETDGTDGTKPFDIGDIMGAEFHYDNGAGGTFKIVIFFRPNVRNDIFLDIHLPNGEIYRSSIATDFVRHLYQFVGVSRDGNLTGLDFSELELKDVPLPGTIYKYYEDVFEGKLSLDKTETIKVINPNFIGLTPGIYHFIHL